MATPTIPELQAAIDAATNDAERLAAMFRLTRQLINTDPPQALVLAELCFELAERLGDEGGIAGGLALMGQANRKLDNYPKAIEQYERARAFFERAGNVFGVANATRDIGFIQNALGEYAKALESYQAALAMAQELEHHDLVAGLMKFIGTFHRDRGDHEIALEHLESALALYEQLDNQWGVATCTAAIGAVYEDSCEYAKALEHYQIALALHQDVGYRGDIATCMGLIGSIYDELGEYGKALEHYQAALSVSEELGARDSVVAWTANIGVLYQALDEKEKALAHFQTALRIAREIGQHANLGPATANIGAAYHELGDHARALEYFKAARAHLEELGDVAGSARLFIMIGSLHLKLEEYEMALESYQTALAMDEERDRRKRVALATSHLGWLYAQKKFEQHDLALAEEYLLRAVSMATDIGRKSMLQEAHARLSDVYKEQGKWQQAHEHLTISHQLKEELYSAETYRKVQQIEHLKQIAEMEKRRALEQAEAKATELRAQLLAEQLDRKEQQLASTVISLARQSETLGRFRSDLRGIMRGTTDMAVIVKELQRKLTELPDQTIDWSKFEAEFEQTYPEFQSRLSDRYPELTKMQLKICSLLRLKLTSIDIAQLLSVSERTVEWHRHKLRKKLGIDKARDLHDVLAAM